METTEKIVESYCRYVKRWFTIPNIKCQGQHEVDLLAVDTTSKRIKRYHVECGVSIPGPHSNLTDKIFSGDDLKIRVKQAGQRRTMGYFIQHKFDVPHVKDKLKEYGFFAGNYAKIVVTWGSSPGAKIIAAKENIELWDFPHLLKEIADALRDNSAYFTDDTARTIQLFSKATEKGSLA